MKYIQLLQIFFITLLIQKTRLKSCIMDPILESEEVQNVNSFLKNNKHILNFFVILNSFLIDFGIIIHAFLFMWYGENVSIFYSFFLFTHLRFISLNMGQWPHPPRYIVSYPGFPSLMVPYEKTNDYYFSGHIATIVIITLGIFYYVGIEKKKNRKEELLTDDNDFYFDNEEIFQICEDEYPHDENELIIQEKKYFKLNNYSDIDLETKMNSRKQNIIFKKTNRVKWSGKLLRIIFTFAFVQTILFLILTSFHYSNDVLIGFISGL